MRKIIFLVLCTYSVFYGCKEEEPVGPDFCPDCTFSTLLNGQSWKGDLYSSRFDFISQFSDTLFKIIVHQENGEDDFHDVLLISKIPYDTGVYVFDTLSATMPFRKISEFWVFEYEFDFPAQEYYVIPDGQSFIHVEYLDKKTSKFRVSFNIKMSIPGGIDGSLHNATYPKFITFSNGKAEGVVYSE